MLNLKSVFLVLTLTVWVECKLKLSVHEVNRMSVTEILNDESPEISLRQANDAGPGVIYASILGKPSTDLNEPFELNKAEIKVSNDAPSYSQLDQDNIVQMHIPAKTSFFIVVTDRSGFDEIKTGDFIYFVSDTMPAVFDLGKINYFQKLELDIETNFYGDLDLVESYIFNKMLDIDRLKEQFTVKDFESWTKLIQESLNTKEELSSIKDDVTVSTGQNLHRATESSSHLPESGYVSQESTISTDDIQIGGPRASRNPRNGYQRRHSGAGRATDDQQCRLGHEHGHVQRKIHDDFGLGGSAVQQPEALRENEPAERLTRTRK